VQPQAQRPTLHFEVAIYNQPMVKRVAQSGTTTLLSKDDRAYLSAFEKAAQRHVDKVTRTPEAAMQELIDAGIYGTNRKLKKQYRSVA
jgi:hypothetical protein